MPKAYKVLAMRTNLSHRKAKELLDLGLVVSNARKIRASDEIPESLTLKILAQDAPKIIFKDERILAVNKPAFMDSYALDGIFKGWVLLNRLDKHTSGVILLVKKDSDFMREAIEAFKKNAVDKEYLAFVRGIVAESTTINAPIFTHKGNRAISGIDFKRGKNALTSIAPLQIIGKNTLLSVKIKTGRTHQIRVHLDSINHPILGDNLYGKASFPRLMLHSHKITLLGYEFAAKEGDFWTYLPK